MWRSLIKLVRWTNHHKSIGLSESAVSDKDLALNWLPYSESCAPIDYTLIKFQDFIH